jgi:hypothetical protein
MLHLRREFKFHNITEYRRVVFRISPSQFRVSTPTPAFLTEVLCGFYKMRRLATAGSCHILPQSIIHKHLDTSQYNAPFQVNLSGTNTIALYFSRKCISQHNIRRVR